MSIRDLPAYRIFLGLVFSCAALLLLGEVASATDSGSGPFELTPDSIKYANVGDFVSYMGVCSEEGTHSFSMSGYSGAFDDLHVQTCDENEIHLWGTAAVPGIYNIAGSCGTHECSETEQLIIRPYWKLTVQNSPTRSPDDETQPVIVDEDPGIFWPFETHRNSSRQATAGETGAVSISLVATVSSDPSGGSENITAAGNAGRSEIRTWTWENGIGDDPVENEDISAAITGDSMATITASISGTDIGDAASSSASYATSGSVTIGGTTAVEVSTSGDDGKSLEVRAYVQSASRKKEYKVAGEFTKDNGTGSVTQTASTESWQAVEGEWPASKSISLSATVTKTQNTNSVASYIAALSQGITGSATAACSNADESEASVLGNSNFLLAPPAE